MVLAQKVCISVVMVVYGGLLSLSGYEQTLGTSQPASALITIRLCMGLIPAVLVVLGLVVMRRWPQQGAQLMPPPPPPRRPNGCPPNFPAPPAQRAGQRPGRPGRPAGRCRAG